MADFDPYYQWLAIPPAEQPPNLYRLLGVTLFEPNLDVISAAADRQMAHVRSYQSGPHSAHSQRLLNELSNARLTLLRPETKASYDEQLRQKLPPSVTPANAASPALKTAKPLKVATPLKTATPLPPAEAPATPAHDSSADQPRVPERLIRPQPILPTADKPAVARPAASAAPAPVPQRPAEARSRKSSSNTKMIRSLVGVVIGGIMGTYLAGVILNALGAELPPIARNFPGMRPRQVKPNETEPKNDTTTNGTKNNPTTNPINNNPAPSVATADFEGWPAKAANFHPLMLPPGKHEFHFQVGPRNLPHVRIDSRSPTGTPIPGRIVQLSEVLARSANTDAGFGSDDTSVFVNCKVPPTGDGMMVLGVTAPPQCEIRETNLTVQVHSDATSGGGMVYGGAYRQFDLANMRATDKLADYKTLKPGEAGNAYFGGTIATSGQTVYLVANLRLLPGSSENLRIWLSNAAPAFATVTVAPPAPPTVAVNPKPPVTSNNPSTNPNPTPNPKVLVPNPNPMPNPATPRPEDPPPSVAEVDPPETKPVKLPKPTDDEIQAARKVVRDLYSGEYAKANTPDKKRALAAKIRQVGDDTKDAPAARYACLFEAATLLTDADDPEAYNAWDHLARQFETSVAREKSALLDRLQKKAKIPSDHKFLADGYIKLVNEAVQADDYPLAHALSNKAEACVKRAGDDVLERTIERGVRDIRQMQAAYEEAKSAKKTLAETPGDAAAGFTWGKYLCLYRGQWREGLELLARGGESEPLAALAKIDIEKPSAAKAQEDLAAAWWKASQSEKEDRAQRQLRSRAAHWYKYAVASATGLPAAQMQQRIAESEAENSPIPVGKPFDALSMIDVASHGLAGKWQRDKSQVAAITDNNSSGNYTELAIPIAIHGNYAFTTRVEWGSTRGQLMFRLPVAERFANLTVGDNMKLDVATNVKTPHPAVALERGKRYEVAVAVAVAGEDATIDVKFNNRPYLSWQGKVADLRDGAPAPIETPPGFPRRPTRRTTSSSGDVSTQPMIRLLTTSRSSYVINTLTLQIDKGYGEPVVHVGRAVTQGRF